MLIQDKIYTWVPPHFTRSLDVINAATEAVTANVTDRAAFNMLVPFGGYKQSGHGREPVRSGLDKILEFKSMQLPQ